MVVGDNQRTILVCEKKLVVVGESPRLAGIAYLSFGAVGVRQVQRIAHGVQADSQFV